MIRESNWEITLSESNGFIGRREFLLDYDDNLQGFLQTVADSHWPDNSNAVPVSITAKPFMQPGDALLVPSVNRRTCQTLGEMPVTNCVQVIAQYALHHLANHWPDQYLPKPYHPPGTTLNLRIKSAGQGLLVTPSGMRGIMTPVKDCIKNWQSLAMSVGTRIILPQTEYHVSCDRMTLAHVNAVMKRHHDYDLYQGAVNPNAFMGVKPGTLLFDGYEMSEGFAADPSRPFRYRLTAALKQRIITDENGKLEIRNGKPVGWNHDYIAVNNTKKWDWVEIKMVIHGKCSLRYSDRLDFMELFGRKSDFTVASDHSFGDNAFCGDNNPCETSVGSISSIPGSPSPGSQNYGSPSGSL